ncbi:DUF1269 domain-containing protein [Ideonella sp. DXS29W]|uniref:DUF1269 domain-containing protein n=1 Tax=Ideonella lacteola TaxID=2984193 RepID=A0ABU9BR38_9BURK
MRRRLYVVLPDVASARQTANDLLLARIEDRHMHFLSRRDMSLEELHEASFLQKTDVRHAFFLGAGLGVLGGAALGVFLKMTDLGNGYTFDVGTLLLCTAGGLVLGAWASTLIGVSTPSVALKPFSSDLEAGKILLMVDVPSSRVQEIQRLLESRHPEADHKGIDLTMPAFP